MSTKRRSLRQRVSGKEGFALVLVLLVLVAVTVAGVSLVTSSQREMSAVASNTLLAQCRHVAEVGAVEGVVKIVPALNNMYQQKQMYPPGVQALVAGSVDVATMPFGYTVGARGEAMAVGLDDITEQRLTLNATCDGPRNTVFTVRVNGQPSSGSVFGCGFCACTDVAINGDLSYDSYDSELGS